MRISTCDTLNHQPLPPSSSHQVLHFSPAAQALRVRGEIFLAEPARNPGNPQPHPSFFSPHDAPEAIFRYIMRTLTVQLPESLRKRVEALAQQEGYAVSQFLASAASEKLAVVLSMDSMDYLRREATAGQREDFDKYLAAVPDASPSEADRLD